ncbi:MAG: phage tail protein [Pseudomonadota bacterium]
MATLVLTAVGTAIGGPLGGAVGAFLGQQVDQSLLGSGSREGPRLKELAVTTSSYGQPIGRHFGRMRVAGTVIWATELSETSSTQGGKGQPKTTTYSYSANFAVALSSTPIARVGRIWSDGNLLRGSGGDLKVGGSLRVYLGHGDAKADPLIAADKGAEAPAFRDCAYVVFEGLELADFGNRIPALTFEIFSVRDTEVSLADLVPEATLTSEESPLANTRGFADEGGALSNTLSAINRVFPLECTTTSGGLRLSSSTEIAETPIVLPEQLLQGDNQSSDGNHKSRANTIGEEPLALRYYDEQRDYQPGVQRAIGRRPAGRETLVDLPATMTAQGAKVLANDNANRSRWLHERIVWRVGQLDPEIGPGTVVRIPSTPGIWRVRTWEWYDLGIELGLERLTPGEASSTGADTGTPAPPSDLIVGVTQLDCFELPPLDTTNPSSELIFVAASSANSAWSGAALYREQEGALIPIGSTGLERAVLGELTTALAASSALFFEPNSSMDIQLAAEDLTLSATDTIGLAAGMNRLLVGSEVVQFTGAVALGSGRWRLEGLLRGRAGTEEFAQAEHPALTSIALIGPELTDLSTAGIQSTPSLSIAAIGRGDTEAVSASLRNFGLSRRPPTPVHPKLHWRDDGSIEVCWTRRVRGLWHWEYEGDAPLVEESERYLLGYGAVDTPSITFTTNEPAFALSASDLSGLTSTFGSGDLWVRQVGTFLNSNALFLAFLD